MPAKSKRAAEAETLLTQVKKINTKFVVVTGGVCSSIGKGVLVSSLGVLLKKAGYSLAVAKWDPYLNVDPGTMSPLVHGEVFVTADGAETDLDLGHYERTIGLNLERDSSVSSGQIYQEILEGERTGVFLGKCIQMVPHVVDVIKNRLLAFALRHKTDFVLTEIGGTVGDMEGEVFLEALRQLKMELGSSRIMHVHLSLVPFLSWTGEIKTKPTQHSVIALKRAGLTPDCLVLRADHHVDADAIKKLSIMCEVKPDFIFQMLTVAPVYRTIIALSKQKMGAKTQQHFGIKTPKAPDLSSWQALIDRIAESKQVVTIGLIAKYVGSNDPYISVVEAIKAAAFHLKRRAKIVVIEAESLEKSSYGSNTSAWKKLKSLDGIVVPGGFDVRGIEGKILAARWAREHNIPYFGLCLGMQIMLIEAARSLLQLPKANSTEFDAATSDPVIDLMPEQRAIKHKGATMRLGSYPCTLVKGTKAAAAYHKTVVEERHRHRYEVNNAYKHAFEKAGFVFSGIYTAKNLVEIAEFKKHPFMLGTQFHPEFQSSPLTVHPLFMAFMKAVTEKTK
ncbi:MAG: CTP synthase [Candidatus Babeliales bacterium]|jgi:CTP synthase